jgi:hypothetical protein
MMTRIMAALLAVILLQSCTQHEPVSYERWTTEKANAWAGQKGWLVGANFAPSTAINQLEMWQAGTFDPETIDRELGWAAGIGMNSMRVFLHNLLWEQDPEGFLDRIDRYLEISSGHGISTMLVLFDGVWDPEPKPGPQREPSPHLHNSGWVQSPGRALLDTNNFPAFEAYVKGVMNRFKEDDRVVIWDLFNEPENPSARYEVIPGKEEAALRLLKKTVQWAREVNPSQPVTAGVWGDYLDTPELSEISRFMLETLDVISFHIYAPPDSLPKHIAFLESFRRPIYCTEYIARGRGNTFESMLPVFKEHGIGAYNWGLVDGKTQTKYPWDSWDSTYTSEPELWHHDVFRADGTPYRKEETDLIRSLTSTHE